MEINYSRKQHPFPNIEFDSNKWRECGHKSRMYWCVGVENSGSTTQMCSQSQGGGQAMPTITIPKHAGQACNGNQLQLQAKLYP